MSDGETARSEATPSQPGSERPGTSGTVTTPSQPMFNVKPPDPVKLGKDVVTTWKLWENYCVVSSLDHESRGPRFKKSLLISTMGIEALQIYNGCDPADTDTADEIIAKLDKHIMGEPNETFERYKFNTRAQKPDESFDVYLNSLKTLVKTCNFCDCMQKTLLRDRIVLGVNDENTRKRLLQERKLTLEKCLDICRTYEKTASQLKVISAGNDEVHKISISKASKRQPIKKPAKKSPSPNQTESTRPMIECKFCGKNHPRKKELCPAWGKACKKCKAENHFAKCCPGNSHKKVHRVQDICESDTDDDIVMAVSGENLTSGSSGPILARMLLKDGRQISFQVDCGATVNVIPQKYVNEPLVHTDTQLSMYNKSVLKPLGKCRLSLKNPVSGKSFSVEFQVVQESLTPLLSRKAAEQMDLITVNYQNFESVNKVTVDHLLNQVSGADTLGNFSGHVHLKVDDSVKPVQCPPRKIPISMKPRLKNELTDLVSRGVVTPVTEPTAWCSQMSVQTKKNGTLRICLDPRPLNKALQRERYPLPVIDDILPDLANAKLFSKLDLKDGYWHCTLDEQSSYLTTFITPFGRYRWLRLPFGLKVSSEIFQRKLNECVEGLKGVLCIADDILVYGNSEDEHDLNLKSLLSRCEEAKIVLNKEKCVFKTTEVEFQGHVISSQGLKPDDKKVEAILKMENPTDVEGIRRLLGAVTYLAKFLPRLSTVAEPLRRLTRKDVKWEWSAEQDSAVAEIKNLVTSTPILAYYDSSKELSIECDASSTGLGAVLLQDNKPLYYTSRALSQTETRYAQIEKECLAIVFALEKFHQYTFGRLTTVYSDHKPLEMIVKKPLNKAPKRLQGMLLRLMQYDVEIVYKCGKQMYLADMLSRSYLPVTQRDQFAQVNTVAHLRISQERLEEIKKATQADPTLQILKSVILHGWPQSKQDVPPQITPYFSCRDELAVYDGLIFKGERVVIPASLRKSIKEKLHSSHLGGESMLRRARECIFWPGMTADIKQVADACDACQSFCTAVQKETLRPIEAQYPWEKVGVDLLTWDTKDYLITTDYFSGFWEIDYLSSTVASSVIRHLKVHFARHGSPSTVISDNGPQFAAEEFRQFATDWDFEHCTSSPGHPQANGKAESAVKAAKRMLKKCQKSGSDMYLALLEIRNTPNQGMESSPVQRLFNRRTRSLIPMTENLLAPRGKEHLKLDNLQLKHNKEKQAATYNRTARDLSVLRHGDTVRMQPFRLGQKEWQKGIVHQRLDDRSYEIETPRGLYRRNRVHLRKTSEQPPLIPPQILDYDQLDEPQHFTTQDPVSKHVSSPPVPVSTEPVETPPEVRRSTRLRKLPTYLKDYVAK